MTTEIKVQIRNRETGAKEGWITTAFPFFSRVSRHVRIKLAVERWCEDHNKSTSQRYGKQVQSRITRDELPAFSNITLRF